MSAEDQKPRLSVKRMSLSEGNRSTGLVGVWTDKFTEGTPTYKLLSDGSAQFSKSESVRTKSGEETTEVSSGFGNWELTKDGQVSVTCTVKSGCVAETDAAGGTEEHVLKMHCMMFEGVFKRQKELNERDEERIKMLSEGKEVPPLHPLTVVDLENVEKSLELFQDEKLSDLMVRLGKEGDDSIKVMLGDVELTEGKPLYETVPAKGVLRLVIPEKPAEGAPTAAAPVAPAPAPAAEKSTGKKDKITEAFVKWDINNEKVIPEEDLSRILVALGVPQEDIAMILAQADVKKSGGVDYSQFINWIYSSDEEDSKSTVYDGPWKDQLKIVRWMFEYVPQTIILDMLTEKNGDRAQVTKALQLREEELTAQFGSKADGLIAKDSSIAKAAALEALSASGGDDVAALKTLQK